MEEKGVRSERAEAKLGREVKLTCSAVKGCMRMLKIRGRDQTVLSLHNELYHTPQVPPLLTQEGEHRREARFRHPHLIRPNRMRSHGRLIDPVQRYSHELALRSSDEQALAEGESMRALKCRGREEVDVEVVFLYSGG